LQADWARKPGGSCRTGKGGDAERAWGTCRTSKTSWTLRAGWPGRADVAESERLMRGFVPIERLLNDATGIELVELGGRHGRNFRRPRGPAQNRDLPKRVTEFAGQEKAERNGG
jgi:hypothetical protein